MEGNEQVDSPQDSTPRLILLPKDSVPGVRDLFNGLVSREIGAGIRSDTRVGGEEDIIDQLQRELNVAASAQSELSIHVTAADFTAIRSHVEQYIDGNKFPEEEKTRLRGILETIAKGFEAADPNPNPASTVLSGFGVSSMSAWLEKKTRQGRDG